MTTPKENKTPKRIWAVFEPHENPNDKVPRVYASASPTKGVEYVQANISPINWGKTSYGAPAARTPVGFYLINSAENGGYIPLHNNKTIPSADGRQNRATIEDAKVDAQKHYETLIWSAFE
ncbi:hypothetical protein MXMO3_01661 [Maritalea myrionectae]|uniref:Uncharacterized protein n=1 Tax=Maritalea myrionectae TaxID=454601 RepID=A0A2R4MDS6_9HYPH|nr:hypothetical protein [Maritalea myrionectae]AVX04187.1 hypothetical protein MXMO3_01661 [Maritalea myrionectae]